MRNISDTTASWFVVLGLLGMLALSAFIPTQAVLDRDVQEPGVHRLGRVPSELSDAAANARVPKLDRVPPEELWWTPSEDWNSIRPDAGPNDARADVGPMVKKVAAEPARTWFHNFFRLRTPAT